MGLFRPVAGQLLLLLLIVEGVENVSLLDQENVDVRKRQDVRHLENTKREQGK
jgi:hypothetical protein